MNIGDKVVCVDDSSCDCGRNHGLILNAIYVVIATQPYPDVNGNYGIKIIGNNIQGHKTGYFRGSRFRRLEEMKKEAVLHQKTEV